MNGDVKGVVVCLTKLLPKKPNSTIWGFSSFSVRTLAILLVKLCAFGV